MWRLLGRSHRLASASKTDGQARRSEGARPFLLIVAGEVEALILEIPPWGFSAGVGVTQTQVSPSGCVNSVRPSGRMKGQLCHWF